MPELWDIARYVETHPEDFEQRWRLAKKLYRSWEYRLALEHLQILKNEWQRKLNVMRYLAATYYRLGRYGNAIEELREAIRHWPEEIGLHEQLAKVLEVDNQREAARDAWERVLALDKSHALASSSIRRIEKARNTGDGPDDLGIEESDSGIDLSPGRVCPNCGAHNSDDHDNCWQCASKLYHDSVGPHATPGPVPTRASVLKSETTQLAAGLAAVGLMSLAIFLTFQAWSLANQAENASLIIATVNDVLLYRTLGLRIALGVTLLLSWPAALLITAHFLNLKISFPSSLLVIGGAIAALSVYLASFLTPAAFLFAGLFIAGAVVGLLCWLLSEERGKAFQAGIVHLALLITVLLSTMILFEWRSQGAFMNPLTEFNAVRAYMHSTAGMKHPGEFPLALKPVKVEGAHASSKEPEAEVVVMWQSTGSTWLDLRGRRQEFVVQLNGRPENILRLQVAELLESGAEHTLIYDPVADTPWISPSKELTPNKNYVVRLIGADVVRLNPNVSVRGLLVPAFPRKTAPVEAIPADAAQDSPAN